MNSLLMCVIAHFRTTDSSMENLQHVKSMFHTASATICFSTTARSCIYTLERMADDTPMHFNRDFSHIPFYHPSFYMLLIRAVASEKMAYGACVCARGVWSALLCRWSSLELQNGSQGGGGGKLWQVLHSALSWPLPSPCSRICTYSNGCAQKAISARAKGEPHTAVHWTTRTTPLLFIWKNPFLTSDNMLPHEL